MLHTPQCVNSERRKVAFLTGKGGIIAVSAIIHKHLGEEEVCFNLKAKENVNIALLKLSQFKKKVILCFLS